MLTLISALYLGACVLLWRPLPVIMSPNVRALALIGGATLLFPGLLLILWARATLGCMYAVSSSMGVELFKGHRLVTDGPYAHVRHPMYAGLIIAALGGILLYRNWTMLFLLVTFLGVTLRARREERMLSAEFGEEWRAYCRAVRGWFPRLRPYRQASNNGGCPDAQ